MITRERIEEINKFANNWKEEDAKFLCIEIHNLCTLALRALDQEKDSARLEWMIEKQAMVSKVEGAHWCEIKIGSKIRSYCELDPRDSIDAAMAESGKG